MRTGKVISFNKLTGAGILQDSNNQTIKFINENPKRTPLKGDQISFEVEYSQKSMVVKNIEILSDT